MDAICEKYQRVMGKIYQEIGNTRSPKALASASYVRKRNTFTQAETLYNNRLSQLPVEDGYDVDPALEERLINLNPRISRLDIRRGLAYGKLDSAESIENALMNFKLNGDELSTKILNFLNHTQEAHTRKKIVEYAFNNIVTKMITRKMTSKEHSAVLHYVNFISKPENNIPISFFTGEEQ